MSFDLENLTELAQTHGQVARITVIKTASSTPRGVGTSMYVTKASQSGTIGGGELELRATKNARAQLVDGPAMRASKFPLGPKLGQCCGGAVTVLTELFSRDDLAALHGPVFARPIDAICPMPLAVKRLLEQHRNQGILPKAQLLQGWMIEPLTAPSSPLWIYGAGHVGRALVATLAALPNLSITWIDTSADRFPATLPKNTRALPSPNPESAVGLAPDDAQHVVLTYSHKMDFDICHAILSRPFSFAGLIGSETKNARFKSRLRNLGHSDHEISRLTCPIGDPHLGKHPQAIAIGVAAALLRNAAHAAKEERGAAIAWGNATD